MNINFSNIDSLEQIISTLKDKVSSLNEVDLTTSYVFEITQLAREFEVNCVRAKLDSQNYGPEYKERFKKIFDSFNEFISVNGFNLIKNEENAVKSKFQNFSEKENVSEGEALSIKLAMNRFEVLANLINGIATIIHNQRI